MIAAKRKKQKKWKYRSNLHGWLFVAPWVIGLLIFYAYPIVASFYFSFTSYSIFQPGQFVGLQNYNDLFKDELFWISIYNTFYYAVIYVPLNIIFGVFLALVLNLRVKGMAVYRTIFYLPTLVPAVALAVLWAWLLNPQFGIINSTLSLIGIDGPNWLGNEMWSKPSLVFMQLWTIGNAVVIYLAGLGDIPQEYYDAASVDGANWFQKVHYITIPLLTPVIFFNLVMGLIGAFQQFTLPYTLTGGSGGPANTLKFFVMNIYDNAFKYFKMGYASAMAWILFIIIMLLTALVFWSARKWVHYQGD